MPAAKPTVAGWKKAKLHTVVLHSGFTVTIKIPDLPAMALSGALPQHLLDAAISISQNDNRTETPEEREQALEFRNLMILETVVEPQISLEDLADIPAEDKEMIVQFATRQREFDAEGNHVSGLHTSEKFRRFRGLEGLYEDVEDLPES